MKIALIIPKSTFLEQPNTWTYLGILYIAARLESFGIETEHFDLNIEELPKDGEFDYLFVTGTSPQIADIRRIAQETKNWKTKRVLGGSMAWTNPQSCFGLGYDLVVSGEADHPDNLKLVLSILENNKAIKHIVLPEIKDLDWSLPPIRRWHYKYNAWTKDKINNEILRMDSVYVTRGCSFKCGYCEVGKNGGLYAKVRYEPLEVVEQQIVDIKENGYNAIGFYDDTMVLNKKRLIKIMDLLEKYQMRWRCFLRSDLLIKHGGFEFLKLMRDKGLREIFVGVESADNQIKKNVFKGTTIEQDELVLQWCKELNITCKMSFIIGLPGESKESLNKTRDWILKYRPDRTQVGIFIPLFGTPLFEHPELFDIKYEKQPDENFFYSGKKELVKSFVSTSHLTKGEIDNFYQQFILELERENISK